MAVIFQKDILQIQEIMDISIQILIFIPFCPIIKIDKVIRDFMIISRSTYIVQVK